ncbi:unnamed protein product [Victoria cruziana]
MESNGGMSGPMLPGMLGLEMPLHQQHPRHHLQQQPPQHQMPPFASSLIHDSGADHHSHQQQQQQQQRHPYGVAVVSKAATATTTTTTTSKQQVSFSDDDEAASGYAAEDVSGAGDAQNGKRGSVWQRMKWTDDMVRLLIMVVFFVGDDGAGLDVGGEGGKKKLLGGGGSSGGAGGLLQKKGKWKSVSRAMLEKGYRVSPQQCEDKFNDLNKRYKRVIDIVGKGTACRVVETPSLLETMDHISPKMKDEVRKLLNSKHLFFREMCAYHSSCAGGHQSCEADASAMPQQHQQQHPMSRPHEQRFLQDSGGIGTANKEVEGENGDDYDEDDEDEEDDDDDEEEVGYGDDNDAREDDESKRLSRKRPRRRGGGDGVSVLSLSPMQQQFNSEVARVLQDGMKTPWEQRQWIKGRTVMLEEQRVTYQCRAFELEQQRFKWQKYSRKKEREFERMKLENERMRLENERMTLLLRQKEMEMDSLLKRSDPSSIAG